MPMSKQVIRTVRGANQFMSLGTNGVASTVATAAREINQPSVTPEAVMRSKCWLISGEDNPHARAIIAVQSIAVMMPCFCDLVIEAVGITAVVIMIFCGQESERS